MLGGPIMTFGSNFGAGLFVVLAGGITSALRRYTDWSTPETLIVGSVFALIVATGVADAPPPILKTCSPQRSCVVRM